MGCCQSKMEKIKKLRVSVPKEKNDLYYVPLRQVEFVDTIKNEPMSPDSDIIIPDSSCVSCNFGHVSIYNFKSTILSFCKWCNYGTKSGKTSSDGIAT